MKLAACPDCGATNPRPIDNGNVLLCVCGYTYPAMEAPCVFCEIVAGRAPSDAVLFRGARHLPEDRARGVLMFTPLSPVTPGHRLFIPAVHVADAATDPDITAEVMASAARYAAHWGDPFNLITSAGEVATQSVFHLHVHYVPRAADDGLMVPWGTLHGENPSDPHRCRRVVELEAQLAGSFPQGERSTPN